MPGVLQRAAEVVQTEPSSKHSAALMFAVLNNHFPAFSALTLSVECCELMAINLVFHRPWESLNMTRQDLFDVKREKEKLNEAYKEEKRSFKFPGKSSIIKKK